MYSHFMSRDERIILMNTTQGRIPADDILSGGQLVNVYSAEILPHLWVAVKGARIAYVGTPDPSMVGEETVVHELDGRFILPGFIDGHTHLDSIFQVGAYAKHALAFGNTAAVSEVAMTANAMGVKGGEYFQKLLSMDRCLGVGESDWPRVTDFEDRDLAQYEWSERAERTREGHAAGARGKKLQAYRAAGTISCHESVTAEDALEKLRLGMAVMIREGYVRRELDAVSGIARKGVDLTNAMIVTDIADPQELVEQGGKVVAESPLPICGIISPEPLPQMVREIREVEAACHRLGASIARPFLSLQTFSFTGLPFLRLTDQGLVDIRKMSKVSLFL
jgi:adenine deaminase